MADRPIQMLAMLNGVALALALVGAGSAAAQAPPSGAPATGDQPSLSDKLNRTDGVIVPAPSGDGEMAQRPPNVGATMPVIPPSAVTPPGASPGSPPPGPR